jgi:hypothetical protein
MTPGAGERLARATLTTLLLGKSALRLGPARGFGYTVRSRGIGSWHAMALAVHWLIYELLSARA